MVHIRPYCPQDRELVWKLAADTAFFGAPVEAFLDDRALFCATFVAYYTDYEPQRLWVAEVSGSVGGYVTGCGDSRRRTRVLCARILPGVLWSVLRGQYNLGGKSLRYGVRAVRELLAGTFPSAPLECFPGHLHLNVAAPARGRGIGRRLLEICLAQLWATGVSGVHLHTTDRNRAACHLYEALGFRLLDARPTRLWRGLVAGEVQNRIYGIRPEWSNEG